MMIWNITTAGWFATFKSNGLLNRHFMPHVRLSWQENLDVSFHYCDKEET